MIEQDRGAEGAIASPRPRMMLALLALLALLVACADGTTPAVERRTPASASATVGGTVTGQATPPDDVRYPDIESATVTSNADGTYDFAVTVSSSYDRPERYADGWRLLARDGAELAMHQLTHDHQAEQPFTRTQANVSIPTGIARVRIQGHDQRSGYGGKTIEVALPGR